MNITDFSYELPSELVGNKAIEPRDSCKLMVLNPDSNMISHHIFSELEGLLDQKCVLVLNDTKVFPARLFGRKDSGGRTEVLLLRQISKESYLAIGKGHLRVGQSIIFNDHLQAKITNKNFDGEIVLQFNLSNSELLQAIDKHGFTPLPPYITGQDDELSLRQQYQTVYAQKQGSAAAPTAGLHFTDDLLQKLKDKGVEIEKITLHVGLGTFKPVSDEQVLERKLHAEEYFIESDVANRLNFAKRQGKKIIAVGTTTARTLESQTNEEGLLLSGRGETSIFIQPGYKFKFVDGLITNFHLPKTSLLMMVSALVSAPNSSKPFTTFQSSLIGQAYDQAISHQYKFFSFGDAMLII